MYMQNHKVEIKYEEYSSVDELSQTDRLLAEKAIKAQRTSYAPYSNFNVGAAVLLEDGSIFMGSNQENAATPSGLCAERTAMFAAGAAKPGIPMISLAIAGGPKMTLCDEPVTPCGACRQVMAEYQKVGHRPMAVIMVGACKIWRFERVDDILPFIFTSMD